VGYYPSPCQPIFSPFHHLFKMSKFFSIQFPMLSFKLSYEGRNGNGRQTGIEVQALIDRIALRPINRSGPTDSCRIEIPKDAVKELIQTLQTALEQ